MYINFKYISYETIIFLLFVYDMRYRICKVSESSFTLSSNSPPYYEEPGPTKMSGPFKSVIKNELNSLDIFS